MSCVSIGVNLLPSVLFSKTFVMLCIQSFNGCGPGALPPDVTNKDPFCLISEKSNIGVDDLDPKYDSINTLIASAHPSIESPIKYLLVLLGFGFLISGNLSTWCFCTEKPTPVPPNNKNIVSAKASVWSIGK